jgi:hypothetical protein
MKKRLNNPISIILFFASIVSAHKFILSEDWLRSMFSGILLTIFFQIGAYYFVKWWEKKAEKQ